MLARSFVIALASIGLALAAESPAHAQIGSDRYSAIVVDARSGTILFQDHADELRFPASLTKMMTLYLLFEAIRDRRVSLNEPVPVSANAAAMPPTKLGLLPGTYITVEQAMLGLVTKSANDAASALGEMLGGDEDRFSQMMTLRARALGMTNTTFHNASGLPDYGQVTTARDMATLGRRLIDDFPSFYRYFSVPSFVFQGRQVLNHQRMLQTYPGADGLKTGYIEASGYNVVTSAVHGDVRLVGVVMGASSGGERDQHMSLLLDQGFARTGAPMVARSAAPNRMASLIAAAQSQQGLPAINTVPTAAMPQVFYSQQPLRTREVAAAPAVRHAPMRTGPTRVRQAVVPTPPVQTRVPPLPRGVRSLPPGYGY